MPTYTVVYSIGHKVRHSSCNGCIHHILSLSAGHKGQTQGEQGASKMEEGACRQGVSLYASKSKCNLASVLTGLAIILQPL